LPCSYVVSCILPCSRVYTISLFFPFFSTPFAGVVFSRADVASYAERAPVCASIRLVSKLHVCLLLQKASITICACPMASGQVFSRHQSQARGPYWSAISPPSSSCNAQGDLLCWAGRVGAGAGMYVCFSVL
jgi:hypothetical protein